MVFQLSPRTMRKAGKACRSQQEEQHTGQDRQEQSEDTQYGKQAGRQCCKESFQLDSFDFSVKQNSRVQHSKVVTRDTMRTFMGKQSAKSVPF